VICLVDELWVSSERRAQPRPYTHIAVWFLHGGAKLRYGPGTDLCMIFELDNGEYVNICSFELDHWTACDASHIRKGLCSKNVCMCLLSKIIATMYSVTVYTATIIFLAREPDDGR
jgi:hypothetical protein